MLIQHKKVNDKGVFFIQEEEDILAEMVYSMQQPGVMIVEHTEVSEELRGQNIGYELVHHAVEYARSHRLKIHPVCSFTKSVLERKPEFADVWI